MIGRRELFAGFGGVMAGWPLLARAQLPGKPLIGYLSLTAIESRPSLIAAFRKGLGEAGFVEGRNVTIEYRAAESRAERLPVLAADLVRVNVDVIAALGGLLAPLAAKRATQAIPIVFAGGGDPVQTGLVSSINRPVGNVTGVYFLTTDLVAKRLGLLTEMLPRARRVAVLVNPSNAAVAEATVRNVGRASRVLGLDIQVLNASTSGEIDAAIATVMSWQPDALFVGPDSLFVGQHLQLMTLAARHALPASCSVREFVDAGALMSYGPNLADNYRQAGVYVGRILKGEKPADLPVQAPTRYELIINLKTAKALGIEVPPMLLARADEVIE